jgi:uncharacterized protein with HEPN domain
LWNFIVLGEAAGRLSEEIKAPFPDVAWQQPVRLRYRLVHGYCSINLGVLHTTASEQLPGFTGVMCEVLRTVQTRCLRAFAGPLPRLVPRPSWVRHLPGSHR